MIKEEGLPTKHLVDTEQALPTAVKSQQALIGAAVVTFAAIAAIYWPYYASYALWVLSLILH